MDSDSSNFNCDFSHSFLSSFNIRVRNLKGIVFKKGPEVYSFGMLFVILATFDLNLDNYEAWLKN